MPPHPFKFAPPANSNDDDEWGLPGDPELEIRFPRQLPESGWSLLLESDKKVYTFIEAKVFPVFFIEAYIIFTE